MPAACFLQDTMQPESMEAESLGNFEQDFPGNMHLNKLVCFFCDKEFPGVQVLHSHQKQCALASTSQKILTDTKNSVGKKRSFLSYFKLIPKAERVRSEKRKDVVLDVIVIDDDSDDENNDISKDKSSQRYLLSPNSSDTKTKANGKFSSKGRNLGLALDNAFAKPSSKVFKFDITSPLGVRLRYHCKQLGNCKLPISKICRANYEEYCSTSTTRIPHSNKCYHVTYRKRQASKFYHRYKFTRAQLREFCRARSFGLSLSSLRLKRRMKPCRISVVKLDLLCDDVLRGTFDVKKYMKIGVDSVVKVSDEEDERDDMETADARDSPPSVILSNGYSCDDLEGSQPHRLGNDKMENSLEHGHPVKRIGAYQKFHLNCPNASCTTVDVFSPDVDSCPGEVGRTKKHVRYPWAFAGNVEFVPLTSLYEQSAAFEVENQDPQTQIFQISSVFSLANSSDNAGSLFSDLLEEQQHCSESTPSSVESVPTQTVAPSTESVPSRKTPDSTQPSSSRADDVITILDHDNFSQETNEQLSRVTETQPTQGNRAAQSPVVASDVIDLTETVFTSLPGSSASTATSCQQTAVHSSVRNTSGGLPQLCDTLCNPSSEKSQSSTDVHKLPAEKSLQSELQKFLEQNIVIEIPDEDTAVFTKQQQQGSRATQSRSCNNNNSAATSTNNLSNPDRINTLPSPRLPDKSLHPVLPTWHTVQPSVQPAISAPIRNDVHTNDTIDLSFDSDSEPLDKEPVATGQKRPLLNNPDSCPPRKRDRPGVSLEHSSLPPLTFKCHICGLFFNFDNNSGTMIQKHYLMHNVTNIELVKQMLPNGQMTWSLVELNNTCNSTHSKPCGPSSSTSAPHTRTSPDCVGTEVSSIRPPLAPLYTPSVMSSSHSAVRQSTVLPEKCTPVTLYSRPDVSSARNLSSSGATRLNSENNCNMLPARHLQSAFASGTADLNTARAASSTNGDNLLSQPGRQDRNQQPVDVLRAIHSARLRPNVLRSTHALAPRTMATSAQQRQQIYFPSSADLNRMFADKERGDSNVGSQMQSHKHNALASIQSNGNIVHGVICLD